ncbi:hypothetical protein QZH41_006653, partial [Actinostola sp. cb2023]
NVQHDIVSSRKRSRALSSAEKGKLWRKIHANAEKKERRKEERKLKNEKNVTDNKPKEIVFIDSSGPEDSPQKQARDVACNSIILVSSPENKAGSSRDDCSSPLSKRQCASSCVKQEVGVESDIVHLHGDVSFPITKTGLQQGISTGDAVTLLTKNIKQDKICRKQPMNVNTNSVFVIDNLALTHPKDLLCDDMGVWTPNGVKTTHWKTSLTVHGNTQSITEDEYGKAGTWKVVRRTYKNASSMHEKLLRITIHLEGIKGSAAKLYMDDIFGKNDGENRIPGLVDSESVDHFRATLESLGSMWTERHANGASFVEYFNKYKAKQIGATMTQEIRKLITSSGDAVVISLGGNDLDKKADNSLSNDDWLAYSNPVFAP